MESILGKTQIWSLFLHIDLLRLYLNGCLPRFDKPFLIFKFSLPKNTHITSALGIITPCRATTRLGSTTYAHLKTVIPRSLTCTMFWREFCPKPCPAGFPPTLVILIPFLKTLFKKPSCG